MTGCWLKATPAVAVLEGWDWIVSLLADATTSARLPKFVVPPVTPDIVDVPDFVILPLASGVPALGWTRTFCQVSLHVTPELLAELIVMVRFVEVRVTVIVDPSARPLIFRELAPLPPIRFIKTVGAV